MIGRLGEASSLKTTPLVLIEVGGAGYEVHMPMTCFYELPEAGQETSFSPTLVCEDLAAVRF